MIPRQTIFALTPLNLSGEVENYNFIVFGLTRKWLQTHVLCSCLYGLVSLKHVDLVRSGHHHHPHHNHFIEFNLFSP
jgi:hypothetical protein